MTSTGRVATATLVAMLAMGRPAGAQTAAIDVDIRDYAGLSQDLLRDVRSDVSAIFHQAGVDITWGAGGFTVLIVSREMARTLRQDPRQMGFTPMGTGVRLTYILDGRIDEVVAAYRAEKTGIMAAAIVHELGHLMLRAHAHAPGGIMRAFWNEADFLRATKGTLVFPPYQAKDLRKSLTQ
jgi:hypothetical protein